MNDFVYESLVEHCDEYILAREVYFGNKCIVTDAAKREDYRCRAVALADLLEFYVSKGYLRLEEGL